MVSVAGSGGLRSLREQPFALLQALERRSHAALAGGTAVAGELAETVGIAFRLGRQDFLVRREETREVLIPSGSLTRVPGAQGWVRGLANIRGQLLPVMDLKAFLGAGPTASGRSTRILVAGVGEFPVGLLVDEVYGFRRFREHELVSGYPELEIRCERYLRGCFSRGEEFWPLFSVPALIESPEFQVAAAD